MIVWIRAGRLLPEKDYMPSAPAPGELPAAVTQAPFELTARPVEQPATNARSAAAAPLAEEAKSFKSGRQEAGPPSDPVLSAACQQDVRQSNQENDPVEALLAEGKHAVTHWMSRSQQISGIHPALLARLTRTSCSTLECQIRDTW